MMELQAGMDFRLPQYRREVFMRFYSFHLKHRTHPGCVYFVLPHLAEALGWDTEQRLWAAFLNGNTQNPVTTLLLMEAGDRPEAAEAVTRFWARSWRDLQWDTDRRHQKSKFDVCVESYRSALAGGSQEAYWGRAADMGWPGVWEGASRLWGFGRLSCWSYLEYVRMMARPELEVPDADSLLLEDISGSRSHRNGICVVANLEHYIWDDTLNPGNSPGVYTPAALEEIGAVAGDLFAEAMARNEHPDAGLLTFESALCTYKSWHKPNRRYPNVYADLLYDRIRWAERRWGPRFDVLWECRNRCLPAPLRLEDNPADPGLSAAKQNHYLQTGQVVMMQHEWACFANDFALAVEAGGYGLREPAVIQGGLFR